MNQITIEDLQEYMSNLNPPSQIYYEPKPHISLNDNGDTLSVQAGNHSYSTPRKNLYSGKYSHTEVGFPTIKPPKSWEDYCEDLDKPLNTVYSYVPIELVVEFINNERMK
tara:strand:- start:2525 stop:2854 length:330 start_codon:yes stop_codon:yes gene_type:complete